MNGSPQINGRIPDQVLPPDDPIAIVGLSLKFPGDAVSAESFWQMLCEGRCAMTEFPKNRFNVDSFYDQRGGMSTLPLRGGHFIKEDLGAFDAPFFSVTPEEAAAMDPQQRILLETTYHALENAGIPLTECASTKTSVFTATFTDDYKSILLANPDRLPKYAATGLSSAMLANRISWFFNFKAASMNLDSACSSSLSALHLACQDLLHGSSSMSIVGGCNLVFHPDILLTMANMSFLSKDSRCWSFDHRANGYARGDGFGVLVLKRLSDALKERLPIRGVIRATGLNQDGRTNGGITQPSREAQKALIRDTFARSNLDMKMVRFFEAHGTGTAIGDLSESSAIGECFRPYRSEEEPLIIGAVKSNIGHLEGGSGVAGVIKTIFVLETGIIPPNTGFEKVNPKIDTRHLRIKFPTEVMAWPVLGLRRACVNSFGFGGSNAFVILDDASNYLKNHNLLGHTVSLSRHLKCKPESIPLHLDNPDAIHIANGIPNGIIKHSGLPTGSQDEPNHSNKDYMVRPRLIVWSAADENSLKSMVSHYQTFFRDQKRKVSEFDLDNVVYTLSTRRSLLAWRTYAVVTSDNLSSLDQVYAKPTRSPKTPVSSAFIFTGQGAQYEKMAAGLSVFPTFQKSIIQSEGILRKLGCEWSLQTLLNESDSRINTPEFSQTCTTALQIGIFDLIKTFGINPRAVIGHSSGEIAAAYCAGLLSKETALGVAYHRGVLAATIPNLYAESLGMLAVALSAESVLPFLDRLKAHACSNRVQIACFNGPKSITLTGDQGQLKLLETWLKESGHVAKMLRVNVAYHSAYYMNSIQSAYLEALKSLNWKSPTSSPLPMVSSVTGNIVPSGTVCDPAYWCRNLVAQVKFHQAVYFLCSNSGKKARRQLGAKTQTLGDITDLLEIGPHSALQSQISDIFVESRMQTKLNYLSTLNHYDKAEKSILDLIGRLWALGYPVNLEKVNGVEKSVQVIRTDLPAYPFNHAHNYWFEDRSSSAFRFRPHRPHELLGSWIPTSSDIEARWRGVLSSDRLSWIQDHQISGDCLLPGAGMICMAMEAAKQLAPPNLKIQKFDLQNIRFKRALQIPDSGNDIESQVSLSKDETSKDDIWYTFRIFSFGPECTEHCSGRIHLEFELPNKDAGSIIISDSFHLDELLTITDACKSDIKAQGLYDSIRKNGVNYGPCFQTLDNIRHGMCAAVADVSLPSLSSKTSSHFINTKSYVLHPSLLDGLFQLVFPALNEGGSKDLPSMVPSFIRRMIIYPDNQKDPPSPILHAGTLASFDGYRGTESNVVASSDGQLRAVIEGYQTTFVSLASHQTLSNSTRLLLSHIKWQPDLNTMIPEQCVKFCGQNRASNESFKSFYQKVSWLMRHYMANSVRDLAQLLTSVPSPQKARFLEWMKDELAISSEDCFSTELPEDELFASEKVVSDIEQQVMSTSKIGEFYVQLASSLSNISIGNPDDSSVQLNGLVDAHFGNASDDLGLLKPLHNWLATATHKTPSMRILELGPSQGATFEPSANTLLAAGLHLHHYEYALSSPDMLAETQLRLNDLEKVFTGRLFDFDKEVDMQSSEDPLYDVVIALHILGEPVKLLQVLSNIKMLLKPGGKLILFGSATPRFRTRLMQAVVSSQISSIISCEEQRFPKIDISRARVEQILRETGFSGIDMEFQDTEDERFHEASVFISSLPSINAPSSCFPLVSILVKPNSLDQLSFAMELKKQLQESRHCESEIHELNHGISEAKISGRLCVSLLDYERSFFTGIDFDDFALLKMVVMNTQNILWIVKDTTALSAPSSHIIDGLSRVLRSENTKLRFVRLTLAAGTAHPDVVIQAIKNMVEAPLDDMEPEYEQKNGMIQINRVVPSPSMNSFMESRLAAFREEELELRGSTALVATLKSPGLLNSIAFEKVDYPDGQCDIDEIVVDIHAVGLSTRDFQVASGQLNDTRIFSSGSGWVVHAGSQTEFRPGDKVLIHYSGSCRTVLKCKSFLAARVPPTYDLLEAAALSTPALTVFHALFNLGKLKRCETVLIHNAVGAVGQMAIQVAEKIGATVIATVSTSEESRILQETYNLSSKNIVSADGTSFKQAVLRATNHHGVDVALNFRTQNDFENSLEVMAPFGRLVDAGSSDGTLQKILTSELTSKCVEYSTVDLFQMQLHRPLLIQSILKQVSSWIYEGKIVHLRDLKVYNANSIPQALQSFSNGEPEVSVVIDLKPNQIVKAEIPNEPLYQFNQNATYVVAGGFGGLGRSVLRWMVSRNARHLLVLSRSGASSSSAQELVEELTASDIKIEAPKCDITSLESLQSVLCNYSTIMPPIRGCIQATMVLRDAIFANMTHDDFVTSTRPKTLGSWNLHSLLPRGMDFFVMLASVGGILGSSSQGNYAGGNAFEDTLARHRVMQGEKAISIDLGMMVSEGVVAETEGMLDALRRLGYLMEVTQPDFYALLDYYCDPTLSVLLPDESQVVVGIEHPAGIEAKGIDVPEWMHRPLFRHFYELDGNHESSSSGSKQSVNIENKLRQAASVEEAAEYIAELLTAKLSQVLGMPAEEMDYQRPVRVNGLNSLAAVEMKSWFDRKIGAEVAVFDILGNMSLMELCQYAAMRTKLQ